MRAVRTLRAWACDLIVVVKTPPSTGLYATGTGSWLRSTFSKRCRSSTGVNCVERKPTVPGAAPLKSAPQQEMQAYRERALRLLCLSGLSGFPQITLPIGTVHDAPFGISLLGPPNSDIALIRLGRRILEIASKR